MAPTHPQPVSNVKIILGAMTFGKEGLEGARVHDLKDVSAILDVFQKHGHVEVDTAKGYTGGTSEMFLAEANWEGRGLEVSTKLYPGGTWKHTPDLLRKALDESLASLNAKQIDIYYLHAPDHNTPFEETLKGINELYKEGKFKRFGLSNYASWEVGEIVAICRLNGYVQPTVYQGIYNTLHRAVSPDLLTALHKYGISFAAYNPLGGGYLTGRYKRDEDVETGSRFDTSKGTTQSKNYRKRYWNDAYFDALDTIAEVAKKYNLTMAEIALRWMTHHSELKKEYGDGIIIGASSLKHIEQNLVDLEKGPLPDEVVVVLDKAWKSIDAPEPYWR